MARTRLSLSVARKYVFLVVVLAVAVFSLMSSVVTYAASPQEVGVPTAGQNAVEMVGKIDQNGLDFNAFGYLTYIAGVPDDQMFTDAINRSEATAHFTYVTSAKLTTRSMIENLFVLDAAGSTTIYYSDQPAATFDDPASFGAGTAIAVSSERWQNVVNVQAPDTGIATGMSEFTETSATPFTLNGTDYQLGHANLLLRFSYTGEGKRSDKLLPKSSFVVAGYAVVGGDSQ